MVTSEELQTAIDTIDNIKYYEDDLDHKDSLESVRQMLCGVYHGQVESEVPTDEELDTLESVLESVDPGTQKWHDGEVVEEEVVRGLRWVEHGREMRDYWATW